MKSKTLLSANSLVFPDIGAYSDFSEYLRKFFEYNRAARRPLSIGVLSLKLKWSKSLIKGFLFGRRKLSMRRALEFAEFAGFDIWETERICKLTLPFQSHPYASAEAFFVSLKLDESLRLIQKTLASPPPTTPDPLPPHFQSDLLSLNAHEQRLIRSKIFDIYRLLKRYHFQNEGKRKGVREYIFDLSVSPVTQPLKPETRAPLHTVTGEMSSAG